MIINCDQCLTEFNRRPSKVRDVNYCCKECRHNAKYTVCSCENCGKVFERINSQVLDRTFCSRECAKPYLSKKMTGLNVELNPSRMDLDTRIKLRESRLEKGEGKSYPKLFGRHEHRVLMEEKIGRPLTSKEVVHHIDHDIRNNDIDNLMLFASQAEHARWHKNEIHNPELNVR